MDSMRQFDVIVVGGGHAGTEAAMASARMGAKTLLLTHQIETIGQMSCNPAIGGIGKGHLVREIDAMGGVMAAAADEGGIQFRILNARKGPAVRATRAQADRVLYKQAVRRRVENQPNLTLFQQPVDDLIVDNHRVIGVKTQSGLAFYGRSVVLTVGTFLAGKIHIGQHQSAGGRAGDPPAMALSERLRALGFAVGRLKTGTPPRIDGKTVNFSVMERQPGDDPVPVFSFMGKISDHPRQVACYITHTSELTHQIIRDNLHLSAMYSGNIEGIGPRYCPSIEDKIVRFADKMSHQIFIEPEGLDTHELYPNGISTSLPFEVQEKVVRSIRGLEHAHITRPGYAIEYDFFDPRELYPTLETKPMKNLFFAGQINGTTGYEEAAAQGLLAGINAATRALERGEGWMPTRDQAYLGVLVDDLVTLGTREPYRMFTSRAEYRLLLREDNADQRLTPIAREFGLVDEVRWRAFSDKMEAIEREQARLKTVWIHPSTAAAQRLQDLTGHVISREYCLQDLLKRPELDYAAVMSIEAERMASDRMASERIEAERSETSSAEVNDSVGAANGVVDLEVALQVEIAVKYEGYILRQEEEVKRLHANEALKLPLDLDYHEVTGLSFEVCQKLTQVRPATLGQAGRIPGVTPAALSLLMVYLKTKLKG